LFTIFINDLDDDIKSDILKSADDVRFIGRVGSEDDAGQLRMDLASLGSYAEKWGMVFNVGKCKVLNIGFKNRKEDYSPILNGVPLGRIKEEKGLGVIFFHDLKVGKPCFKAASKGN